MATNSEKIAMLDFDRNYSFPQDIANIAEKEARFNEYKARFESTKNRVYGVCAVFLLLAIVSVMYPRAELYFILLLGGFGFLLALESELSPLIKETAFEGAGITWMELSKGNLLFDENEELELRGMNEAQRQRALGMIAENKTAEKRGNDALNRLRDLRTQMADMEMQLYFLLLVFTIYGGFKLAWVIGRVIHGEVRNVYQKVGAWY